jgi:hypothetical protein
MAYTSINNFEILTENPDEFLEALEALCEEFAIEGEYGYEYSDEEGEETEEEETEEAA